MNIGKAITNWKNQLGVTPKVSDVKSYITSGNLGSSMLYSTVSAVGATAISFIVLQGQPLAILTVLGFSFIATSAAFYVIGDVKDEGYILKAPQKKKKVKVEEPVEVKVEKPVEVVKRKPEESIVDKGRKLTEALSEYKYSAGGGKICVGVTHYNDQAPMVVVYKIIPVKESVVFKQIKDLQGVTVGHKYDAIDLEKYISEGGKIADIIRKGVDLSVIKGLGDNLARDLGLPKGQKVSVDLNVGDGQAAIYLPKENRDWVYLEDYLDTIEASNALVPMFLGKTLEGDSLIVDMVDGRHSAIVGMNKSGKTVSMIAQLLGLAYARSPANVEIMLIDPKFVGFNILKDLPHVKQGVITDLEEALYALERVETMMNERYAVLRDADVQDIVEYNALGGDNMNYLVIAIDEFLDLLEDDTPIENEDGKTTTIAKRAAKVLGVLFKKGRGCGIHLNVLSQRFAAEDIPGAIRNNAGLRVCLSVTDVHASRMVLEESGGETLLGYGDTLTKLQDWNSPVRSQGAGFKNDSVDIKRIVNMVNSKWQGSEEKEDGVIELESVMGSFG